MGKRCKLLIACIAAALWVSSLEISGIAAQNIAAASETAEVKLVHSLYGKGDYLVFGVVANDTDKPLEFKDKFRLEILKDGKWTVVRTRNSKDNMGYFSLGDIDDDYILQPGEKDLIKFYISGFEGFQYGGLPAGNYRITLFTVNGIEYVLPFRYVDTKVEKDAVDFQISTARPVYSQNIRQIKWIMNNPNLYPVLVEDYVKLQRFDGKAWNDAALKPRNMEDNERPSIGKAIYRLHDRVEVKSLKEFQMLLASGKYRIILTVNDSNVYGAFEVIDKSQSIPIDNPQGMILEYDNGIRTARAELSSENQFDGLTDAPVGIMEELLSFQKSNKPAGNLTKPVVRVILSYENQGSKTVSIYFDQDVLYAEMDGAWYSLKDPYGMNQLYECVRDAGGYAPESGEDLIRLLQSAEALNNVQFVKHDFTNPYVVPGWLSDKEKSGVNIAVFQFQDLKEANERARYIWDGGYTIVVETVSGDAVSFSQTTHKWEQPPHFYKAGSRLVLYCGSDSAVINALDGLLGEAFAEAE